MFLAPLTFLREGSGNERLGVPRNTGEITQVGFAFDLSEASRKSYGYPTV